MENGAWVELQLAEVHQGAEVAHQHGVGVQLRDAPVVPLLARLLDANGGDGDTCAGLPRAEHGALKPDQLHPVELDLPQPERQCRVELRIGAAQRQQHRFSRLHWPRLEHTAEPLEVWTGGDRPFSRARQQPLEVLDHGAAQGLQARHRQVQTRRERFGAQAFELERSCAKRAQLLLEHAHARARRPSLLPSARHSRIGSSPQARCADPKGLAHRAAHLERERMAPVHGALEQRACLPADGRIARHPHALP